jgi:hypothetical protein
MIQPMSALRAKFRKKVVDCLDLVEASMQSQLHLTNEASILDKLDTIDTLRQVCSEDEREYIESVLYAIKHKIKWER